MQSKKEGIAGFTLNTLQDSEGLGRPNYEPIDAFFRGGWIFITCGDLWVLLLRLSDDHEEKNSAKVEPTKARLTL